MRLVVSLGCGGGRVGACAWDVVSLSTHPYRPRKSYTGPENHIVIQTHTNYTNTYLWLHVQSAPPAPPPPEPTCRAAPCLAVGHLTYMCVSVCEGGDGEDEQGVVPLLAYMVDHPLQQGRARVCACEKGDRTERMEGRATFQVT